MATEKFAPLTRRRLSLSVRVSLGLVIAAIIPLLITLLFSELQARPTLTAQASAAMQSDARTRVQLIDTYFNERLLDAQTLTQVPSLQEFLAAPPMPASPQYKNLQLHALYSLQAGTYRDKRYGTWTLFDPAGKPILYYPTTNPPRPHGQAFVTQTYQDDVRAGKTFISAVYYSKQSGHASVDIYSPIITQASQGSTLPPNHYLGFIRATLNLDYIWNIVDEDKGSNGIGSYAFILDNNGVRIADTDRTRLMTAVAPLTPSAQQEVQTDDRYGSDGAGVPLDNDASLANQVNNKAQSSTFQLQPAGQAMEYQATQRVSSIMPWKYFVLSPVSTVTSIADQQLWFTVLIAVLTSAFMAIIGLLVGRNIVHPISKVAQYLRNDSHALSLLATRQQDASSEQAWVVDSTQVGLQSVRYYTDAINIAAQELNSLSTMLRQDWGRMSPRDAYEALERITAAAIYIESATDYQHASNEKLGTALKVATQVTEQLASGATSATTTAARLEDVVTQLRNVVGK